MSHHGNTIIIQEKLWFNRNFSKRTPDDVTVPAACATPTGIAQLLINYYHFSTLVLISAHCGAGQVGILGTR